MVSWAMGRGAHALVDRERGHATHLRALDWLQRFGPRARLVAWLPIVGDPLCGGRLAQVPALSCAIYMAIGKFLRYLTLTWLLLWAVQGCSCRTGCSRPQAEGRDHARAARASPRWHRPRATAVPPARPLGKRRHFRVAQREQHALERVRGTTQRLRVAGGGSGIALLQVGRELLDRGSL